MRFRVVACCLLCLAPALRAACIVPPGSVLRIAIAGEALQTGVLARPVYSATCLALREGLPVRVVAGRVQKNPSQPVWRWIRRIAGAREMPPSAMLRGVEVGSLPVVPAEFVRLARERRVEAAADARSPAERILLVRTREPLEVPGLVSLPAAPADALIPAGTRVRAGLLTPVSSAASRDGDAVSIRLLEPVVAGGCAILPEGTVVEGVVSGSSRAHRPYRAGKLRLSFRTLRLASGERIDAALAPAAGRFSGSTRLDAEGGLRGGPLDRKRALLNVGLAYATGKILDDLIEESAKAALGAAVAGSAATAARYVGLAAGALVFLMRRGPDIDLPADTELELTFSRELPLHEAGD